MGNEISGRVKSIDGIPGNRRYNFGTVFKMDHTSNGMLAAGMGPPAPFLQIIDDGDSIAGITFIGRAAVGSTPDQPVWQIQRIDKTAAIEYSGYAIDLLQKEPEDRYAGFVHVWDDRTSLAYDCGENGVLYYGRSTNPALTDPNGVLAEIAGTSRARVYEYSEGDGYLYIMYPTRFLTAIKIVDYDTGFDAAMEPPATQSVTPPGGPAEDYYIYRTSNILHGAVNLEVS